MDDLTCPTCQGTMRPRVLGHVTVRRCDDCAAVLLESSALGALVEAENDWHSHRSTNTATLPRITADMAEPPESRPRVRAYVETLFTG